MHILSIRVSEAAAVCSSTLPLRSCSKFPPRSPLIVFPFPRVPTSLQCAFEVRALCRATSAGMIDDGTVTPEAAAGEMVFEPILEKGVFRFDCSENDRDAAFPSLSFANPKARETAITVDGKLPEFVPIFEREHGQQIVKFQLPLGTSLYGTGEVSGQFERTGKRIFTWNTDAWGYISGTTSLYQSHPWVLAVMPDGKALGVLADTTRKCEIDLRKSSTIKFVSTAAYPVITFGPFKSPTDVLISLSHAIGTVFMPPKWSLGYHQCRWSYETDERVRKIASNFRERGIPCDAIWMDIDYMHGFRCFTFDKVLLLGAVKSGKRRPMVGVRLGFDADGIPTPLFYQDTISPLEANRRK